MVGHSHAISPQTGLSLASDIVKVCIFNWARYRQNQVVPNTADSARWTYLSRWGCGSSSGGLPVGQ